jgi:hypothetical protein
MVSSSDSVMAIVSVPSWWPFIKVSVEREWLEPDGTAVPVRVHGAARRDGGQDPAITAGIEYQVNLPSYRNALEAIIFRNDNRQPSIDSIFCDYRLIAQRGALFIVPACVIKGNRLWRNPVVVIGASRHDKLTVLPDMKGLLVEFPPGAKSCGVNLTVWTSEGVAETAMPDCDVVAVRSAPEDKENQR